MDASVAIPLGSLVLGAAMVVFAALTFKSQRDDIRQKAEVDYVKSVEGRLAAAESRERICVDALATERRTRETNERQFREEINRLTAELLAFYQQMDPPQTMRRMRRPSAEEEEPQ